MGEIIKKNWLTWLVSFLIAAAVPLIVFSRTTSYQESLKTQEAIIKLDKDKASREELKEEENKRVQGDKEQEEDLSKALKDIREALDKNNREQTDRLIEIYKRYK